MKIPRDQYQKTFHACIVSYRDGFLILQETSILSLNHLVSNRLSLRSDNLWFPIVGHKRPQNYRLESRYLRKSPGTRSFEPRLHGWSELWRQMYVSSLFSIPSSHYLYFKLVHGSWFIYFRRFIHSDDLLSPCLCQLDCHRVPSLLITADLASPGGHMCWRPCVACIGSQSIAGFAKTPCDQTWEDHPTDPRGQKCWARGTARLSHIYI